MRTIGFRLGLLVFGCLFIAFAAGAGVIYTVRVTDRTVDRALDAQRRLDLLTEMSGRIQQYGLVAISTVDEPDLRETRLKEAENGVDTSIHAFEPELGKAISQADLPASVNAMAARGKPLEQVRAGFHVLVRQVNQALSQADAQRRGDLIRGAFNGFATMTGPYLFFLMQADRRGVEAGREEARGVSATVTRTAAALVVVAFIVALVMFRLISRPILAAVAEIRDAAIAIGQGERNLRLPVRNRDELGLLAVVFNRMTARLRRGEQRVATDRLALETTIEERTRDLRAVNETLSNIDRSRRRFFADVSHELRTPLTVILGECDVALVGAFSEPERAVAAHRAAFTVIHRRAQRLQRRVEDMLRVARSESGTIELHFAPIVLQEVCLGAIETFLESAKRKQIALRLEPSERETIVDGDSEWLRQIVEGMIDNATRYATGASCISILCGEDDGSAILAVRDDGPGFGIDDPQVLLERFARGDTQPEGFASRKTIDNGFRTRHRSVAGAMGGGQTWRNCQIAPGGGPADRRRDLHPPAVGESTMTKTLVDPDVLVVEDDPDIGALLDRGLGAAGFDVKWVDTAGDALRHVALHGPKAILLDVTLPDGTGYDVCRALRQKGYSGTILFLSAKDEVSDRVDGLAAGGDDYIVKPFAFGELVARLRAQLLRRETVSARGKLSEVGGLSLDPETRQARFADVVVKLTQRELDLLSLFMEQPNRPIARGDIFDRLWHGQGGASLNVVDVYIGYLRSKFGDVVKVGGPAIATVRGRGFMLEFAR